jgi:hypothetical protein
MRRKRSRKTFTGTGQEDDEERDFDEVRSMIDWDLLEELLVSDEDPFEWDAGDDPPPWHHEP